MDKSEDEAQNPLSEENWMKQKNCKFIKSVIHHRHPMTPEQLKQKEFEEIFKESIKYFFLSLGLDTLFFLQSILSLIVQTKVSAV